MNIQNLGILSTGIYQGALAPAFDCIALRQALSDLPERLGSAETCWLAEGGDRIARLTLPTAEGDVTVAVKVFKRQSAWKDRVDRHRKTSAERSYLAATQLQKHQLGTPDPIAWLSRWEAGRLLESYYLCRYDPAPTLRDVLSELLCRIRDNAPLMDLLHRLAPAVRRLHDAGIRHGDLGNQNILVPEDAARAPLFIDLNRARITSEPLSPRDRAFDLSRLALPTPYLGIFKLIYSGHQPVDKALDRLEQRFRRRFAWHTRSRTLRHPIRTFKNRKQRGHGVYPAPENLWLWDDKSAQPAIALVSAEKTPHRLRHWRHLLVMVGYVLLELPGVFWRYRQVRARSFGQSLSMTGRAGIALHPHPDYRERELALLDELGNPPVLVRFYHHESESEWAFTLKLIDQLKERGIQVMAALIQDRDAVLQPALWEAFLERIVPAIADKVQQVEITHAGNRVKWGIWSAHDYRLLIEPAFRLQKRYPSIQLTGPACIDFEYYPVIAALKAIPRGEKLNALSHLLYVDRRGSPENTQAKFSTLEKCALLKSMAEYSKHTESRVIISEVNWPIKYTGIWSPIGGPYTTPQWRVDEPGETEQDYASFMLRYLVIALCSGHIDQVYWWRLSAHGYGLVDDRDNFRRRPAFYALKTFNHLLGNAQFVCKWNADEGVYLFEFSATKQRILMAWCDGLVDVPLPDFSYVELRNAEGELLCDRPEALTGSPVYLIAPANIE